MQVFAVVALASARPDVSELSGYKYSQYSSGAVVPQISGSSQYASGSRFGSGTLEVIPLNLAHVSSTIIRPGDGSIGKGGASYSSNYQYSSGSGYNSGNTLGSQYYNAGGNFGGQQYYAGASPYSSGAALGAQYSSGTGLGAQYASGAGLGAQYYSGAQPIFTDSADNSGFFAAQGSSSDASGYHQLINDVLSGRYTVGSYSGGASAASAHKQKLSINIQPNQVKPKALNSPKDRRRTCSE